MTTADSTGNTAQFADWLVRLAQGLGYARDADLARALGVPQSTVSRWRRGVKPSVEHLIKISQTFGVRIEPLLALAGHVPPSVLMEEVELPEPPSPVTITERMIENSELSEPLKEVVHDYWKKRLDDERRRLKELISFIRDLEQSDNPTLLDGTFTERLIEKILKSHLIPSITETLDAAVKAMEPPSKRRRKKTLAAARPRNEAGVM